MALKVECLNIESNKKKKCKKIIERDGKRMMHALFLDVVTATFSFAAPSDSPFFSRDISTGDVPW